MSICMHVRMYTLAIIHLTIQLYLGAANGEQERLVPTGEERVGTFRVADLVNSMFMMCLEQLGSHNYYHFNLNFHLT